MSDEEKDELIEGEEGEVKTKRIKVTLTLTVDADTDTDDLKDYIKETAGDQVDVASVDEVELDELT